MSRKQVDHDYTLRSVNNLMGERWKRISADGGERSLIKAPSSGSISSPGAAPGPAGAPAGPPSSSTGELERAARKQFQQDVTPGFVYVLAAFSALGGFLYGYDTGVISGAMLLLKRELQLSALWQELLISSTVAAAALSALLGGFLNGLFGRRVCVLLASFCFTLGGIVLSAAPGKEALLAGRIIVGVGLGKILKKSFFFHPTVIKSNSLVILIKQIQFQSCWGKTLGQQPTSPRQLDKGGSTALMCFCQGPKCPFYQFPQIRNISSRLETLFD
uniref:Major facilitator superfamily (MFS) profile domain-containing protein n=1 Tax=Oryzias sinensis TaxID=183150 RepID=A0A8C7WV18_9TELE